MRLLLTRAQEAAFIRDNLQRLAMAPSAPRPSTDNDSRFVAHLIAEVTFWRLQFAHERQRAEVSIDQRLHEHALGPVTLRGREAIGVDDPVLRTPILDDLMRDAEFAAMGNPEGVPT